jgi:hypothetical protein
MSELYILGADDESVIYMVRTFQSSPPPWVSSGRVHSRAHIGGFNVPWTSRRLGLIRAETPMKSKGVHG